MYDRSGWENGFPDQGAANALFAADHLSARIEAIFDYAGSPRYPVMVTEFNVHLHDTIAPSSLLAALFYVDFTIAALRDDDIIGMARWQVAQPRNSRNFRGAALFATNRCGGARNDLWKSGPYYAALLLGALDRQVVDSQVESAPTWHPEGLTGRWRAAGTAAPWWTSSDLPVIASVATLSDDGTAMTLLLLNKDAARDFEVDIRLTGFAPSPAYGRSVLNTTVPGGHGDLEAINPWRIAPGGRCVPDSGGCSPDLPSEGGERVTLRTSAEDGAGDRFTVRLPAHSATVLTISGMRTGAGSGP